MFSPTRSRNWTSGNSRRSNCVRISLLTTQISTPTLRITFHWLSLKLMSMRLLRMRRKKMKRAGRLKQDLTSSTRKKITMSIPRGPHSRRLMNSKCPITSSNGKPKSALWVNVSSTTTMFLNLTGSLRLRVCRRSRTLNSSTLSLWAGTIWSQRSWRSSREKLTSGTRRSLLQTSTSTLTPSLTSLTNCRNSVVFARTKLTRSAFVLVLKSWMS